VLILLEEINATMKQLARYWGTIRESGDPKISPAVDALNEILYMGRQLRMHVLLLAQSATARALGGPEVREQFATRILARYSMNAWRMLAPEVHPAPKSTKHPGRAQVVIGGTARETQVLFFTDAEAREWATTGRSATPARKRPAVPAQPAPAELQKAADGPQTTGPDNQTPIPPTEPEAPAHAALHAPQDDADDSPGTIAATSPGNRAGDVDDQAVGLREAAEHHLPYTLAALRYARANDRTFPGPVDKRGAELLYRVGDLKRWARNRPRAASSTTDLD
jgi:hypothetical protein